MMRLACCQNVAVVAFWYQWELFAYIDYATGSTLSPTAAQAAISAAAQTNVTSGTLSASGQALYNAITGRTGQSAASITSKQQSLFQAAFRRPR